MAENIEMDDLKEERQEEREDGMDDEEEETSFYHEQDSSLEDFSDNTLEYKGNLPSTSYESNKNKNLKSFVRRKYGRSLKLDTNDGNALELRSRTTESPSEGILFKPIGKRGGQLKPQIVLKPAKGRLEYNESKVARNAVEQFKALLEETVESEEERDRIREDNKGILVDTNTEHNDNEFPGLTDIEKKEMDGFLNPPEGQPVKERAFLLGIENNNIRNQIAREEPGERLESLEKYLALNERLYENLKVRESQEEDITRLQKIRKWLKENLVGLSAVGISIAGIITTIIMAERKALVKGGQGL